MGVHLHKAIGWALPMVSDPLDRNSDLARLTLGDHAKWLRRLAGRINDEGLSADVLYEASLLDSDPLLLDSCVIHVPELDGGTLLIVPPAHLRDWSRMDDDLDCAFAGADVENAITYTDTNPYSFSHLWMDAATGLALDGPAGDAVSRCGTERGDQAALRVRVHGEKTPAYASVDAAKRGIAPAVPREITGLVRHLGRFLDPTSLLQLRPARAVWVG